MIVFKLFAIAQNIQLRIVFFLLTLTGVATAKW